MSKWLLALAIFGVGAVCGGAIIFGLKESHTPDPLAPDEGRAFAPVGEPEAGRLATRFHPWLMFDSGEKWRPQSIDSLLAERDPNGKALHEFCVRLPGKEDECEPVGSLEYFETLVAGSRALGSSTYLDVNGKSSGHTAPERSPACRRSGLLDCDDQPGSAIYYHVTSSNQRFYIDYWWFLRFNHFGLTSCSTGSNGICDEHEGDWEGVTLVTAPEDERTLDYVVYAAHRGTFRYPAQQLKLHGRRPIVYVANGSHASYPRSCRALIACSQSIAFAGLANLPETNFDGRRPWARNADKCEAGAPGSCLLPLPNPEPGRSSWTTWGGLWGATCGTRCRASHPQAPASPGLQNRFQAPWCSTLDGTQTCDSAAQGCNDWLGPLVAALTCNPSGLARGLRTPEELPSGGLTLEVIAPDETKRELSATTKGVVQALGPPLQPGSRVVVRDAGSSTEILLRAASGMRLLEARFGSFAVAESGRTLEIAVRVSRRGVPVLRAVRGDGARIAPVERRRLTLKHR